MSQMFTMELGTSISPEVPIKHERKHVFFSFMSESFPVLCVNV